MKKSFKRPPYIDLANPLSAVSWAFIFGFGTIMEITIFAPEWHQYLIYFLAEAGLTPLTSKLSGFLFLRIYPETSEFFPKADSESLIQAPTNKIEKIFPQFQVFPKKYAIWCFIFSWLKAIPSLLLIIFLFTYEHSWQHQLTLAIGLTCVNFLFFSGLVYIESHKKLTNLMYSLLDSKGWQNAWRKYSHKSTQKIDELFDLMVVFSPLALIFIYEFLVITEFNHFSKNRLILSLAVIGFSGLMLTGRSIYLWKSVILEGIQNSLDHIDLSTKRSLPINSYHHLARIDQSFNTLLGKIENAESDLRLKILNKSEQSKYEALGEMTALIAHDIAAPLQVIKFCSEQLYEDIQDQQYGTFIRLFKNLDKCESLVKSLKVTLRSEASDLDLGISTLKMFESLRLVFQSQFPEYEWGQINFVFSRDIKNVFIRMKSTEIGPIFENIISNSIKNNKSQSSKLIQISFVENEINNSLIFEDNGPGFTHDVLDYFNRPCEQLVESPHGLGLRLIKRLIEINLGSLHLKNGTPGSPFTKVIITLPKDKLFKRSDEFFSLNPHLTNEWEETDRNTTDNIDQKSL